MVRAIYARSAAQHKNPVPNAAVHRGVLVTSAILGKDPSTDAYYPEPEQQVQSVFEQLSDILEEAGGTLQDVVKLDLYLADKNGRALENQHWTRLWPDENQRPARQAHQAVLPLGCFVQIVAMAVLSTVSDG